MVTNLQGFAGLHTLYKNILYWLVWKAHIIFLESCLAGAMQGSLAGAPIANGYKGVMNGENYLGLPGFFSGHNFTNIDRPFTKHTFPPHGSFQSVKQPPLTPKNRPKLRQCIEHMRIIPGCQPSNKIRGP